MGKGLWSIVAYPESSDITNVIQILVGSGADCMYILHDRDKYDSDGLGHSKGDFVKLHYHIACGWSNGYPNYRKLRKICAACGAVAPSPEKCEVHGTVQELKKYFLHKDDKSLQNPCKFEYEESDLQCTECWNPSDYERAEDRRSRKSGENKKIKEGVVNDAVKIIKTENFSEWWELVDYYATNFPESMADLCSAAFPIKSYMDSLRYSCKCGDIAEIKKLKEEIEDLKKDLSKDRLQEVRKQLADTREILSSLTSEYEVEQGLLKTACIMLCSAYSDQGEFYSYVEMMRSIRFNYEKSIKNASLYDKAAEM